MLVSGMHSQNCILSRCKLPSAAARNPAWQLLQLGAICGNWLNKKSGKRENLREIRAWLDERNHSAAGRVIRIEEEIG